MNLPLSADENPSFKLLGIINGYPIASIEGKSYIQTAEGPEWFFCGLEENKLNEAGFNNHLPETDETDSAEIVTQDRLLIYYLKQQASFRILDINGNPKIVKVEQDQEIDLPTMTEEQTHAAIVNLIMNGLPPKLNR